MAKKKAAKKPVKQSKPTSAKKQEPTPMTMEELVFKHLNIKQKKAEDREDYLKRIALAINDDSFTTKMYDKLPSKLQKWYESAVELAAAGKDLPDLEARPVPEPQPKKGLLNLGYRPGGEVLEDEPAPVAESPEEPVVEEEPALKKNQRIIVNMNKDEAEGTIVRIQPDGIFIKFDDGDTMTIRPKAEDRIEDLTWKDVHAMDADELEELAGKADLKKKWDKQEFESEKEAADWLCGELKIAKPHRKVQKKVAAKKKVKQKAKTQPKSKKAKKKRK